MDGFPPPASSTQAWPPPPPYAFEPGAQKRTPSPWWLLALVPVGLALFALGVAVGIGLNLFDTFGHDDTPAVVTYGSRGDVLELELLAEGRCFDGSISDDLHRFRVGRELECDQAHQFEAFGRVTAPEPANRFYSGDDLAWFGTDACVFLFHGYVGRPYHDSSLDVVAVVPTKSGWAEGRRELRCLLFDMHGASVKGAARDT